MRGPSACACNGALAAKSNPATPSTAIRVMPTFLSSVVTPATWVRSMAEACASDTDAQPRAAARTGSAIARDSWTRSGGDADLRSAGLRKAATTACRRAAPPPETSVYGAAHGFGRRSSRLTAAGGLVFATRVGRCRITDILIPEERMHARARLFGHPIHQ